MNKLSTLGIATALTTAMLLPQSASAVELDASANISTVYLWRGQDVSAGSPLFDVTLSTDLGSGIYSGIWIASESGGEEYDLYAGWGGDLGPVSLDVSIWNYIYPSDTTFDSFGELTEIIVSASVGPVSFTYYDNIAGGSGYAYYTLAASFDKFGVSLGTADTGFSSMDYTHLDLSYSYNDYLSFTASTVVDTSTGAGATDEGDTIFVASLSLPIDLSKL
ncbi:MAG: hypothetical protein P1U80_00115 [Pseudomonadales bacterium]|nr:hypothetical protein [Pseudomonadales bacterium]